MKLVWRQKIPSDLRRRPYMPFLTMNIDRLPLCIYCKYTESSYSNEYRDTLVCTRTHHYIWQWNLDELRSVYASQYNGCTSKCKWQCGLFRLAPELQEEWTQYQILTDKINAEMGHKKYPLPNQLELVL
jgi:hypothetical protein